MQVSINKGQTKIRLTKRERTTLDEAQRLCDAISKNTGNPTQEDATTAFCGLERLRAWADEQQ